MTLPQIPAGRPPTPPTLQSAIAELRHRIDELARRGPAVGSPVCRVKLNVDVSLPAATDVFAQDNWIVGEDPDGIAQLSTAVGTRSQITVPISGRYLCHVRGAFTGWAAATTCVAYMTRNGGSIVRDPRNTSTSGGDGTVAQASRPVFLNAGDVLQWAHWCGTTVTLDASTINVPTEVGIYWMGTR